MIEKVKGAIARYDMLEEGERVAVALSGGADSVSLLLALSELNYSVFAVHVNHNLRGEESLRDQRFCEALCQKLGVPIFVESVDVLSYCSKEKCSVELGARELRYEAIKKHADCCKIATAHTLSDSLETTIFNLARGCGVKGVSGIPPKRGFIIRPLIDCSRSEIEKYLWEKGQDFVTDSTNLEAECSRNIIRLNVIPELERINPGLIKTFFGTLESLRSADMYIEAAAEELLKRADKGGVFDFSGVPADAALSRAVAVILKKAGVEPSFERIQSVIRILNGGSSDRINLKKGVYIKGSAGKLTLEYDEERPKLCVSVTLRESTEIDGKTVIITKISPFDISDFNKGELRYLFDEAKMARLYTARHYDGNEKIRLPGRGISSTVKKLLSDLPPDERRERLVISDGEGAVFVEGVGVSERVSCGEETLSAIKIDIKGASS